LKGYRYEKDKAGISYVKCLTLHRRYENGLLQIPRNDQ